jgi:hypothetical protein
MSDGISAIDPSVSSDEDELSEISTEPADYDGRPVSTPIFLATNTQSGCQPSPANMPSAAEHGDGHRAVRHAEPNLRVRRHEVRAAARIRVMPCIRHQLAVGN